jgi:hypothetical protein
MSARDVLAQMRRRWFGRCEHENVRCVHGDEIIANRYRRGVCLDCNRSLQPLPFMCSWTGKPHPSYDPAPLNVCRVCGVQGDMVNEGFCDPCWEPKS